MLSVFHERANNSTLHYNMVEYLSLIFDFSEQSDKTHILYKQSALE